MKGGPLVTLDVGGEVFKTYYDTIMYSGYLHDLFSSRKEDEFASFVGDNEVFLDRDNDLFSDIMFYLQNLQIPSTRNRSYMKRLKLEAEFYRISSLVNEIEYDILQFTSSRRYYLAEIPNDSVNAYAARESRTIVPFKKEVKIYSSFSCTEGLKNIPKIKLILYTDDQD